MSLNLSQQDSAAMVSTILRILNDWEIKPEDQVALLGLPEGTRPRALSRYESGTPLPEQNEVIQRVTQLLAIQTSLDTMFPHNTAMANYWVTTENVNFNDRRPLDVMLDDGLSGISYVAGLLNNTLY